jgi:tetratricopeptide (TPR) repeat protein
VFLPNSVQRDKRIGYLYLQGAEFGDNEALRSAIDRWKHLIALYPRERVPLQWAMTQDNLGRALDTLGERESGTEKLEEAVSAYREALKERTRERVPIEWAMTQNNLGAALLTLGERESGTATLEKAVEAYGEALKEFTKEAAPHWHRIARQNLDRVSALLAQQPCFRKAFSLQKLLAKSRPLNRRVQTGSHPMRIDLRSA